MPAAAFLSTIISEMYQHNIFSFILTSEKAKQKNLSVHILEKKKQAEVQNSCKNR